MHPMIWLRLARWLGPWTSLERMPEARREVHSVSLGAGRPPLELVTWAPVHGKIRGALFVIPGLHFQGPAHPRLERMARICAHAGLLTAAPALPDYLEMRIREGSRADAMAAFEAFLLHPELPAVRPGVMGVSFGVHPALHIASSQAQRERVGGVISFGGYLNWKAPIRYSWDNGPGVPFDARNNPVAYTFLMDQLPAVPDPGSVQAAWDSYIRQTWGIEAMRSEGPREKLAESLAAELGEAERQLFLQGCRMGPQAVEQMESALGQAQDKDWLDTGRMLEGLRSPLLAVHSLDDEISPPEQSRAMVTACPPHVDARLHLTGLYGHSGQHAGGGSGLRALLRELRGFGRILSGLVEISTQKFSGD